MSSIITKLPWTVEKLPYPLDPNTANHLPREERRCSFLATNVYVQPLATLLLLLPKDG